MASWSEGSCIRFVAGVCTVVVIVLTPVRLRGRARFGASQEPLEDEGDSLAGVAVSERVLDAAGGFRPRTGLGGFFEEFGEPLGTAADETSDTRLHGLGAFGVLAEDEERTAKGRSLLLDAAGVGDDQPCLGEEGDEVLVAERLEQMDARVPVQGAPGRADHRGIRVYGEDESDVGPILHETAEGDGDLAPITSPKLSRRWVVRTILRSPAVVSVEHAGQGRPRRETFAASSARRPPRDCP